MRSKYQKKKLNCIMIQLLCECVPLNRIASVAARCSKSDMWCYCLDQRYANENSNKGECRTNRTVQYFHSTRNTIDCSHVWNDRNPLHGTFYPSSMHHKNCFAVFQSNRFGDYQKVTIFPFIFFCSLQTFALHFADIKIDHAQAVT